MGKKGKESGRKNVPWWAMILIILLAILYFNSLDNINDSINDYSYCVNECSYDVTSCMDYPDFISEACIKESHASQCLDELDICISECDATYGS
jgi:hypothetical protein